jgi:hypothetical protein
MSQSPISFKGYMKPWILNQVQDDKMEAFAKKSPHRHSGLDPESTATSNRRDNHTSRNPKPWILNQVQDDRKAITTSNRTNK